MPVGRSDVKAGSAPHIFAAYPDEDVT